MTTFIIGFTIWLGLASVALVFNYAIHNVNPRDDEDNAIYPPENYDD